MNTICARSRQLFAAGRNSGSIPWILRLLLFALLALALTQHAPLRAAEVAAAGDHSFLVRDDGTLWVDGNGLVTNNNFQGLTTRTGTVAVVPGGAAASTIAPSAPTSTEGKGISS